MSRPERVAAADRVAAARVPGAGPARVPGAGPARGDWAGVVTPALYDCTVTHARQDPVRHAFRYRSSMWLVDLADLPALPGPLRALARFEARDHLDIGALVAGKGIDASRFLMLAAPRSFGYAFNPISVYWCLNRAGALVALVAEVHNTYGDRTAYVLPPEMSSESQVAKEMYVSPFYPVDGSYRIRISEPGDPLRISVALDRPDDRTFRAALVGRRRPARARDILASSLRYPLGSLRVRALVQWQGIRLWRRGLTVQTR